MAWYFPVHFTPKKLRLTWIWKKMVLKRNQFGPKKPKRPFLVSDRHVFRENGQRLKNPNFSTFFYFWQLFRNNLGRILTEYYSQVNFLPKNNTIKLNSVKLNFLILKSWFDPKWRMIKNSKSDYVEGANTHIFFSHENKVVHRVFLGKSYRWLLCRLNLSRLISGSWSEVWETNFFKRFFDFWHFTYNNLGNIPMA